MNDYISREAAIKEMSYMMHECFPEAVEELDAVITTLKEIPAADVVEVVRCKDCIHRPSGTGVNHDVKFPDDECPCKCPDTWYSWMPPDDWYCADGKRMDGGQDDV